MVKQYCGAGLAGQVAAGLDASVRRDRKQRAAALESCRKRYATAQEPLNKFEDCVLALLRSALGAVGYRYRYSRWRKCNVS